MSEKQLNSKDLLDIVCNRQVLTACLAVFVVLLILYKRASSKKYRLPPGPLGVPILGYLPFLGQEPFKKLNQLKKKYGNVFRIRMGMNTVVILGDFEAVTNIFSNPATNDRPPGIFDFIPDSLGFAGSVGEEWTEQRRFCVKSMRGHGIGGSKWESIIEVEVSDFIQLMSSFNGQPLDFSKILMSSISNNISTFVFGKRLPFNHPDRKFLDSMIEEIYVNLDHSSILFHFPFIKDILVAVGVGKAVKSEGRLKMFNEFFRKEVKKMKETYKSSEEENFIVDYLREMDTYKGKSGHYFNERNMFGNIQALFIAGSDTSAISISWLLLAMAKFPDIQTKVQQEVDSVLGKDGRILWSERKKLPYTYATIMEGQRWKTLVPLNSVRLTTEDIKFQNYDIPKGTTIIANNWGLHNDPRYWREPEKFEPSRFLCEDGKEVLAKLESYVPFSYGKRNCPGEVIAFMEILMYFTSMMQKFRVSVPKGKSINLDGKLGLTYHSYPQELCFVPREQIN